MLHAAPAIWKAAIGCGMAALLLVAQRGAVPPKPPAPAPATFAARIAALSEAPGYFDTDNLISNERSYLHVAPDLEAGALRGGAYLGVGPDQNFSYIVQVRPAIAIIVDLRRDNLLLHLLFKALFARSSTRAEYLAALTGRAPPPASSGSTAIEALVGAIDRARPLDTAGLAALRTRLEATIRGFGVPLSAADFATIDRFHREFTTAGLDLQFRSTGRAPQRFYPTYRDLLLETDLRGRRGNFLASEDGFQFLKALQARDGLIPVVGNLAGTTALPAIAAFLRSQQAPLTVFYTSNVEFYLFRDGSFPAFVRNLARLPRRAESVIVRSAFNTVGMQPGYGSASLTQSAAELVDGFAAGRFQRYSDIVR